MKDTADDLRLSERIKRAAEAVKHYISLLEREGKARWQCGCPTCARARKVQLLEEFGEPEPCEFCRAANMPLTAITFADGSTGWACERCCERFGI